MRNDKKNLLSAAIGVAVGSTLGVLFAPHKGSITRRMIRRKGTELAENATESIKGSIEELGENINDKYETVKKDLKAKLSS